MTPDQIKAIPARDLRDHPDVKRLVDASKHAEHSFVMRADYDNASKVLAACTPFLAPAPRTPTQSDAERRARVRCWDDDDKSDAVEGLLTGIHANGPFPFFVLVDRTITTVCYAHAELIDPPAEETKRSVIETLDAVHAVGGSAWDEVDDPDAAIREMRGDEDGIIDPPTFKEGNRVRVVVGDGPITHCHRLGSEGGITRVDDDGDCLVAVDGFTQWVSPQDLELIPADPRSGKTLDELPEGKWRRVNWRTGAYFVEISHSGTWYIESPEGCRHFLTPEDRKATDWIRVEGGEG